MYTEDVNVWEEVVTIPTYPVGKPDKNPMFLEKRVYQGSSGVVYPHPVIDKIYDEKTDKQYKAVFLENEYLKIMILPELGGRVQMALDKTNNYHFVYYNRVIKPALVGLAGPWISGGIEFNWPQHHRPSTFDPVDYAIEKNKDGSKTVWCSEIEKMFHLKGMAGFTLYPGKAYLEIKGRLYNRTSQPLTFLWWANPAVSVGEDYQSVFPPDVQAVFDHGKRDVSNFPIATGTYYKVDYAPGTDISMYKNIPVPTSYMAAASKYDFVGGYHHGKKAGLLHVADHHIAPGKKQWTWGNGDFGKAWDRNLTDDDGPYIELMTGVFTDNQPDFSWIGPYEEKSFTQYFLPYKALGVVKNATTGVLINLEIENGIALIGVYVTSVQKNLVVQLWGGGNILFRQEMALSPEKAFTTELPVPQIAYELFHLAIYSAAGEELVTYTPEKKGAALVPQSAKAAAAPKEIATLEQLYLTGLHIEQYRHAIFQPIDYYLEALRRDSTDVRNNNAYGLWLFKKGRFAESEAFFKKAIQTLSQHNPNPYDGEPYYNLGLTLKMQERLDEAYTAFYKATWNAAWQDSGYFSLAQIAAVWKKFSLALEQVDKALVRNGHNHKARHLKTILLRKIKEYNAAETFAKESLDIDVFNFGILHQLYSIYTETDRPSKAAETMDMLKARMRQASHNYIEIAIDYAQAGFYEEAIQLLSLIDTTTDPLVFYYTGFYHKRAGDEEKAKACFLKAASSKPDCCFPNRQEDIVILQTAIKAYDKDSQAWYYLGNLWYDKKQYAEAIQCWEKSRAINPNFATVHRNLAIAYFNKEQGAAKAKAALEQAFALDPTDARVLYELDQLYKKLNKQPQERLLFLEQYEEATAIRDDLYLEKISLYNLLGQHRKAAHLLAARKFHPWEGGEGKVTGQFVLTQLELAKQQLGTGNYEKAIKQLSKTEFYPHNLGEGKLWGASENDIHYFFGCTYQYIGDNEKASEYFKKASSGTDEPSAAIYYNDQQPEKIFYQGLALLKLHKHAEAELKFQKLIDYGKVHQDDKISIDYFAVSLPDMLIFEEDLNKRNGIHCRFMAGLGYLGQGKKAQSEACFRQVLSEDANHIGAAIHLKMVAIKNNPADVAMDERV